MTLSLGIVATANKPGERRVPLHPALLDRLPDDLRSSIWLEEGYGERFGRSDDDLAPFVAGFKPRDELFDLDVALVAKPTAADVPSFREGLVLWGWPHTVQQDWMAQAAIDHKMTVIAWENMHTWSRDGSWQMHVFQKNNEIAGYAAILHALSLVGRSGIYGPGGRAAVLGFGSTGRGAIHALQGQGYQDISVFTQRHPVGVTSQVPGILHHRFSGSGNDLLAEALDGDEAPLYEALADFDIIVNCTFQDPTDPLMFVAGDQRKHLKDGALIVDVSCDEGMGFDFARPTSFAEPMFDVDGLRYYAVDHTPSYLYDAASWEIGQALLPFVPTVLGGPAAWDASDVIRRAIDVRDGVVVNEKVLSFQGRAPDYPHAKLA